MTSPADPALRADRVTVRYGAHLALSEVSFELAQGELVAVIGPNGAGKSTLFRALCGLVPHHGTVELLGQHCHHRRDRMDAAYIPQRSDIDHHFPITVGQLVLTGRRRFLRTGRRAGPQHRRAAAAALRRVGLASVAERALSTLSGGQVQRAFLARALAQEARLLFLDEALSGVDQPRTESLLDLFDELRHDGATLLVATHDLALARRRFGRCLAINTRLVADGPPGRALVGSALEATFGSAEDIAPDSDAA